MESLEDLLTTYNFQKREIEPGINIEETESIIGFGLPGDYKTFLKSYEAFEDFIGPQYLRLWNIDELLESNEGYGIIEAFSNTIGIGTNGSGDFIGIQLVDFGEYRVILSPLIFEEEYHIEIGTSFHDMIFRLHNGTEWFN